MKKLFKLGLSSVCSLALAFSCACTAGGGGERVSLIEDITTSKHVNLYGRHYYSETKESTVLPNVASGVEVKFYGTELKAETGSMHSVNFGYDTLLSVLVDGDTNTEKHQLTLRNKDVKQTVLISGLKEGWHTVKVLKRDSSSLSLWLLASLSTDGYFAEAPARPETKIMVYGDSITAGSDINRNIPTRVAHDGLLTYIMRPVLELGYEVNVFARGGAVMACEWVSEPNYSTIKNYDKVAYDTVIPYDMHSYEPDVIVIYLGTNDYAVTKRGAGTQQQFEEGYISFIEKHVELYGEDVKFILCRGSMADFPLDNVVSHFEGGRISVELLTFDRCNEGHPVLEEHRAYGLQMKAKLLEVVGQKSE